MSGQTDFLNQILLGPDGDVLAIGVREIRDDREPIVVRLAEEPAPVWKNTRRVGDVTNDHVVSALDALAIINLLSRRGEGALPESRGVSDGDFYYDVDGDGAATAFDALLVINRIARSLTGSEREDWTPAPDNSAFRGIDERSAELFDESIATLF